MFAGEMFFCRTGHGRRVVCECVGCCCSISEYMYIWTNSR